MLTLRNFYSQKIFKIFSIIFRLLFLFEKIKLLYFCKNKLYRFEWIIKDESHLKNMSVLSRLIKWRLNFIWQIHKNFIKLTYSTIHFNWHFCFEFFLIKDEEEIFYSKSGCSQILVCNLVFCYFLQTLSYFTYLIQDFKSIFYFNMQILHFWSYWN